MAREVVWARWDGEALEHLWLSVDDAGVLADGLVVGMEGDAPFRLRYRVQCDAGWRVREVDVDPLQPGTPALALRADGEGRWMPGDGAAIPALEGCLEVDIRVTPFTNTLPIRRLALRPGEARELAVAYVAAPRMEVTPVRQRYTCLEAGPGGGLYRYEGLSTNFVADLPVDADGLVLDYPGVFLRVWP